MKIERTRNAKRNIVFGILLKLYQLVVPFVMRTAIIYLLGIEYLGLNSLFTSVLQVLNLAELGVGSAMVYSMYKPIAEDDVQSICALMNLYKVYYRVIGIVVAVIGLILLPFIPRLITGNIPANMNIYVLYLLNLGATVLSYWLFAYKNSILQAHQRTDITSKVTIICDTIKYSLQIMVLAILHNYYFFVLVILISQIITNIVTAIVSDHMYPQYSAKGNLPKKEIAQINKRIRDLFTSKLGTVIVNSADTLVISAFLGLTMLAIYQNYFYLLSAVIGLVTIIFNSCTAGIGNSIIIETKEKNFNDFQKFTFIIAWLAGMCTCCFLNLFQPFMEIWVGKDLMLEFPIVISFCIYYFIFEINQLLNLYKDAAGIWHEDRFRPLVTALANLIMNLVMVKVWGIYGVILSTVLSMLFIGMPWLLHNIFTVLFYKKDLMIYLKRLSFYTCSTIGISILTYILCGYINVGGLIGVLLRLVVCIIVSNVLYFCIYFKLPEFTHSVQLVKRLIGKNKE